MAAKKGLIEFVAWGIKCVSTAKDRPNSSHSTEVDPGIFDWGSKLWFRKDC